MKHILFIHGSADLYGSSKVLVSSIESLDRDAIKPIVILPYRGTLDAKLASMGFKVLIGPVAALRRQNFNPAGACAFILCLIRSVYFIRKLDKSHHFSAVYSNTSAVLSGAFYAWLFGKRHIWHIHEITVRPALFRRLMPRLIARISDICIVVSNAVKEYIMSSGINESRIKVVYDGTKGVGVDVSIRGARPSEKNIVIGMAGRLNRWKGQEVFVSAASKVIESGCGVHFLIAGSCYKNEEKYTGRLIGLITELNLKDSVRMAGHIDDMARFYENIDVLVVPSTEPEPFGLVAIEAMSAGIPVIASNIGALPEIVIDGRTGILFEPGNAGQLKDAMIRLAKDGLLRKTMGEAGLERQRTYFTEDRFRKEIREVVWTFLKDE